MLQSAIDTVVGAGQKVGMSARELAYFVADAFVESGLNPKAVGDQGTSFGLFQHHVGGAGGPSLTSARRYLDAQTSASERARVFGRMNADTGAEVAAIQRPANRTAYARNVDAVARRILTSGDIDGNGTPDVNLAGGASAAPVRAKWSPIRDQVRQLAGQYRLTRTDGDRAPNAGYGAPNSDHSTKKPSRWADDYSGATADMQAFEKEVKRRWPQLTVLGLGHAYSTGPNIHVAGDSEGGAASSSGASQGGLMTTGWDIPGIDLGIGDKLEWIGENATFVLLVVVGVLIGGAFVVGGAWRTFGGTAQGAATTVIPAARAARGGS